MKSFAVSAVLASVAIASPCSMGAGIGKRAVDACAAAPNCETYDGPYGKAMRFVENMGPDSEWYNQTIRPADHAFQLKQRKRTLVTRQDEVHTNLESATEKINYGGAVPTDLVGQMAEHCGTFNCDGATWTADADYVTDAGDAAETRTLTITTTGQFDSTVGDAAAKDYFIEALRQMASTNVAVEDKDWINGGAYGSISEGTVSESTAPGHHAANRFVNGGLAGFATITITEQPTAESTLCEDITGGLSTITGAFYGPVGDFFGILGLGCSAF